jgi:hypothetical protein
MFLKIYHFDNSHYYSLRSLGVTAGNAAFAAIPICRESGSTRFSYLYSSECSLSLTDFTEGARNNCIRLQIKVTCNRYILYCTRIPAEF